MGSGNKMAKVGRPPLYSTSEKLQTKIDETTIKKSLRNRTFVSEKKLQDYLVLHIKDFCRDVLNDEFISLKVDCPIRNIQLKLSPRVKRIDFIVQCVKKTYLVELKNPYLLAENRYAIGQLLDYGREFLDSKKELVLLTTKFDLDTAKTIEYYSLPIRYIYFNKGRSLEFRKTF